MDIVLYIALAMALANVSAYLEIGYCLYLDLSREAQENTSIRSKEFP